ncbi:Hpt domain-containing protein [Bryocella elongata]|nr:Hpt domain-containing protein [Bryocella elongata]
MMMAIWERNLPLMRERLDLLDRATLAVEEGSLAPELRSEAASTAHKLAGSLGMYGYAEGTDLARHLEHALAGPDDINAVEMHDLTKALRETLGL